MGFFLFRKCCKSSQKCLKNGCWAQKRGLCADSMFSVNKSLNHR
ncbi:hypothetical protein C943_03923 [Mariniradius saccharolyticus AK6]|uniref:Uncharacterized protein n=1 Tax=Mariniradius saccharolyticus AK6 TaxID=1239962 RepID=M7YA96_9BACT|nr:hypothetical protein C943_03923 [Mariniradius saccharolyticus AK6]